MPWTAALVLSRSHGGMIGAVSWAAMVLVGEAVLDLAKRRARVSSRPRAPSSALAGIALSLVAPVSKNRVSASYALISLGFSLFVLALYRLAFASRSRKLRPAPSPAPWRFGAAVRLHSTWHTSWPWPSSCSRTRAGGTKHRPLGSSLRSLSYSLPA